jgi:diaminopimelate decarboxylase
VGEEVKKKLKKILKPAVQRLRTVERQLEPGQWGMTVTPEGNLAVDGICLASLREKWGSPLHVVLAGRLRRNVADFLAINRGGRTRAEVFYSYKSNPVPGVLAFLRDMGIGAEVISEYELWLAFKLGVPEDQIVFNGPAKSLASIREAMLRDILLLNVNHFEEIEIFSSVARELNKRPRVGVRVATSAGWAGQFGLPIATGEAFAALKKVHESDALALSAIHSHVGGMVRDEQQVDSHVREVLALADRVRSELGAEIPILDFGGSLASRTVAGITDFDRRLSMTFQVPLPVPDPTATLGIREYVERVVGRVEEHYKDISRPCPRIFFEPGRAMTSDAQVLVASVLSLREDEPRPGWAILDTGINVAEPLRSEFHQIFPANRMHAPRSLHYKLAGPICSPGDVLSWSAPLPALEVGDALAIMDAGAYFVPFATSFSFPQPAIVMLDGAEIQLLRRAETFEDIVALDER